MNFSKRIANSTIQGLNFHSVHHMGFLLSLLSVSGTLVFPVLSTGIHTLFENIFILTSFLKEISMVCRILKLAVIFFQ